MALIKELENNQGVKASYHRISLVVHRIDGSIKAQAESFLSQEARESGKSPVSQLSVELSSEEVDHSSPLLPQLYSKMKQLPEMVDAQDA